MVILEDSIMQKGIPATVGSKMLENFIAPFDATVVTRLKENNIEITGRTKMSDFGLSGGETCGLTLCNDLFGTYRRAGICYIHPTYGTVSRYGLIPLAPSMDQIGVACKDLYEGFDLLSKIAGNDPNDGAMFPEKKYEYKVSDKKIKIAGSEVLKYTDVYEQVMAILSCAEISNNLTRYDGIKFGYRTQNYKNLNDLYINTRSEAFGLQAKLVSIMGAVVLSRDNYSAYYEKAMKIRRLIKQSLRFDEYDVIELPTGYEMLAQLTGLPSISFNGIQLIADVRNENALLTAWEVAYK